MVVPPEKSNKSPYRSKLYEKIGLLSKDNRGFALEPGILHHRYGSALYTGTGHRRSSMFDLYK